MLTLAVAVAQPAGPDAAAIDSTPALRVGSLEVPTYLFDKFHRRFVDAERQRLGHPPDEAACKAWLEGFACRQVAVARALELGYGERPEVARIVRRMERTVLTQPGGLLERSLDDPAPIATERLERLYAASAVELDATLVRFSDAAAAAAALGADFERVAPDEKQRRLAGCRGQDGAVWHDGPLVWPFESLPELDESFAATAPGSWFERRGPTGVCVGFVRAVKRRPQPPLDAGGRDRFAAFARQVGNRRQALVRRAGQLAHAHLVLNPDAVAALQLRLSTLPEATSQIPVSAADGGELFRFELEGATTVVTTEDYGRHFNALFIRRLPRTAAELRAGVEDFVLEELDVREARARGLDRTPQFVEDRQGFAHFQALELFEKEQVLPGSGLGETEIERYYRGHPAEFTRTVRVRGRLVTFREGEAAARWAAGGPVDAEALRAAGGAGELCEVTRERGVAGLEELRNVMIDLPAGQRLGPLRRGADFVVFLKEEVLESGLIPLADAAPSIRATLERAYLDTAERRLATEWSRRYKIDDRIDPARYGVTTRLDLPWRP